MQESFRLVERLPPGWRLIVDERVSEGKAASLEIISPEGASAMFIARKGIVRDVLLSLANEADAPRVARQDVPYKAPR